MSYDNRAIYAPRPPSFSFDDATVAWFWWPLSLLVIASVILLLVIGIVNSGGGRGDSDHLTPLPAGVVELNPTTYLLSHGTTATASTLCFGNNGDANNPITVSYNNYVPQIKSFVVQCGASQHWNVHVPNTHSFFGADKQFVEHQALWVTAGIILAVAMLPSGACALRDWRRYRHRLVPAYKADLEDIRRELRIAFANGEIDDDKMIESLNRLYSVGVKPEQDAPLPREIKALDSYGKE